LRGLVFGKANLDVRETYRAQNDIEQFNQVRILNEMPTLKDTVRNVNSHWPLPF
jgi:hypothetical protein